MDSRMNKEELIELIESLNISKEDFVVLSSGALVLRGIMESAGDLDIAVTKKGFDELNKNYHLKYKGKDFYTVTDKVECVIDDMVNKKEKIGAYYVQDINHYLDYLKSSNREKDKLRIPLVKKYIMGNMQYKSIEEQNDAFIQVIKKNNDLIEILKFIEKLKLPNFYIVAGSVFQTIWNYYDNKPINNNIKDIDVIYFDKSDLTVDKDIEIYNKIKSFCDSNNLNYEIDVSNEARMHLWKKEHENIDIEQYKNSEDAINHWIANIHAIGITMLNNEIKIYAPFGLSDIFSKTIRPIKHNYNSKELYDKKVKSWSSRFDNLNIVKW